MQVLKFAVPNDAPGGFSIEMPTGARVLSFGLDGRGVLCIWALCSSLEGVETRPVSFTSLWTGHAHDGHLGVFRGTAVSRGLVVHLFEHIGY